MELLVGAAIPCGPVNNMEHLFADPQVLHREMIAEVPHPTIGTLRLAGIPIKYSETPGQVRSPPPLLGEHTDEILSPSAGLLAGADRGVAAARGAGVPSEASARRRDPCG